MRSPTDLDAFYSQPSIEEWAAVLGPGMHYHHGYFLDPQGLFIEETLEEAQRRAVEYFYPWIPDGARVLDIGCGWGGTAQMLIEDKEAHVLGLTISRAQAAYCRNRGLSVEVLDVEQEDIPGSYEVGLMLEVLEHIRDKRGLLARLRSKVDRLLLSVNCVHDRLGDFDRSAPGWLMVYATVSELRADLEAAGWRIEAERNRRLQALPTARLWKRNLDRTYGDTQPPGQLGQLRLLVDGIVRNPRVILRATPLIDIVAC